jgi:hypothetical protein
LPPYLCARLASLGAQAIAGFSALQIIFLCFYKKMICKALIPFIGVRFKLFSAIRLHLNGGGIKKKNIKIIFMKKNYNSMPWLKDFGKGETV